MQGADTPVARGQGGSSERAECGSGDLETRGVSEAPTDRGKSSVPVRGTGERCEGPFTSAPTWPQTGFILGAWTSQGVAVHLQEWWQMTGVPPCVVISVPLKAFPGLGEGWACLG